MLPRFNGCDRVALVGFVGSEYEDNVYICAVDDLVWMGCCKRDVELGSAAFGILLHA